MKAESRNSDILFHYTTVATLMKILDVKENEKLSLRATHAKFFNDPYEYDHAISLLKTSRNRYENENSIELGKRQKFDKKGITSIGIVSGFPFLLSLSENADDLTMWRTYGADGKGVAIGFDKKMLLDYTEDKSIKNTRLLKCEYGGKDIIKVLTKYWGEVYDKIHFDKKIAIESFRFLFDLSNFCFIFKRPEYKNENEWRLCKNEWELEKIKFMERNGTLIPYIEHLLPREIIKKIIIGPCVNRKLTRESIEIFLIARKYSFKKDSIILSYVPYRPI